MTGPPQMKSPRDEARAMSLLGGAARDSKYSNTAPSASLALPAPVLHRRRMLP